MVFENMKGDNSGRITLLISKLSGQCVVNPNKLGLYDKGRFIEG